MNFSDGVIYVDYAPVEGAADDMVALSQSIMSIIENLKSELTVLKESWIGDDAEVYGKVQAEWDQAVENIKILLAQNSAVLTDISSNYRYTEQSLAQRWGDIKIGSH
ncbi:WXG100 family type VII secretion target [Streptomyces sp. NPDC102441]|uniref:WXG100 family type VII secretion target n=1 Tax=Streptomyces sp. NPDC102441 TaxID=3366176 RepID=UPI0038103E52